jgi:hypothetical protein
MSINAGDLREGLLVAFHSIKKGVPDFFLQGRNDGNVFPTRLMTDPGTQWIVHKTANQGVFRFECQNTSLFLEGNASQCRVRLASGSSQGMEWRVRDFPNPDLGGFDHVSLQCQSNGCSCSLGFLDIIDKEGHMPGHPGITFETDAFGLIPESSSGSAAHWEMILLPVGSESGGPGPGDGTVLI